MHASSDTMQWLLAGDPAVRWHVMRDLLHLPESEWQAERCRMLEHGWAARLLAQQNPDGGWGLGEYSPKWTSTTYTLLTLREFGLPRDCTQAQRGAQRLISRMLGERHDSRFQERLKPFDRCIAGMILEVCVYFGVEDDRIDALVENLLSEQMDDGGWNCRRHRKPYPHHSSFHTTINVLDGLRVFLELRPGAPQAAAAAQAEQRARELLLEHRLFRSDKTGEIIRESFAQISYPHRWFYDYLRALDHFVRADAPRDARLQNAIDLLLAAKTADGRWRNQVRHTGKEFFILEPGREPSRWNTLRALRALQWWQAERSPVQMPAAGSTH